MRFSVFEHVGRRSVVLGQQAGEKLRIELLASVRQASHGETIEISFEHVDIVSTLAISTFLVPFLDARRDVRPPTGVVVVQANEDQQDVIAKCMSFGSTTDGPLFIVNLSDDGRLVLLGKVDEALLNTWTVACKLGEFRASDLSEAFSISPQLANNRLQPFVRVGGLIRSPETAESGVRQYLYRLPLVGAGRTGIRGRDVPHSQAHARSKAVNISN